MRISRGGLRLATAVATFAALIAVTLAGAATTHLPSGAALTVTIGAPADGTTLAQAPFTVTGQASVGAGLPVKNTLLLTVIDVSGSTINNVPLATFGNQNIHDSLSNTILDCELAAAKALNARAVTQGTVRSVGVIGFGGGATSSGSASDAFAADLDRGSPYVSLIAPEAATGTAVTDVDEVLASAGLSALGFPSGGNGFSKFTLKDVPAGTNYWAAVYQARLLAASVSSAVYTSKIVVMLSDGDSTSGGPGGVPAIQAFTAPVSGDPTRPRFFTFAIGAGARCSTASGFGDLQDISSASGGTCQEISNPNDAAAVIQGAIASQLTAVRVSVDGGAPAAATVTPTLPQTGPATVDWTFPVPALSPGPHTICATSSGSDGGGTGTTPDECVTVTVKAPPTVDAGADRTTAEGSPVTMNGSITGGTGTWASSGGTGTCTPADPSSPTTQVTCNDDGVYTLTYTGTDSVGQSASDSATITVTNVAPTPTLTLSAGPHPLAGTVTASVAIADPGSADTQTCSIAWGDATTTTGCGGSHSYAAAGSYTVTVTATDDDGDSGTDSKVVSIDGPPVVNAGGARTGSEGALIALGGSVTDGGSTTNTWSATPGSGVDAGATCVFTNASAPSTTVRCTDDGTWTLTLRADDGVNPPVSDTIDLTLVNAAPTIAITGPPAGASTLTVALTSNVADPGTNDVLTCSIAWGDSSSSAGTVSGGVCSASHTYAAGTVAAVVTATVSDDDGASSTASRSFTFNRAPSCTGVSSSLTELWPPNHALRLIVLGGATDPDGDALSYTVTSVRQDEPLNGTGDGDTSPDAQLGAPGTVWLRAERAGGGDGRVYTVGYHVSDGNASCTGSVRITVPHSAKSGAVLTPGPGYNSLG